MPIRIQNNLPAKEILESENIFVMDESRVDAGYPSPSGLYPESHADQGRYGIADPAGIFQYPAAGQRDLYDRKEPQFPEYICQPLKPVLRYHG